VAHFDAFDIGLLILVPFLCHLYRAGLATSDVYQLNPWMKAFPDTKGMETPSSMG